MKVILVTTLLSNPSLMVQAWHAHQHMHMHMHTRLTSSSSSSHSHSSHSRTHTHTQLASSKDSPQDPNDVNADAYQRYHRSCFESNDNGSDSDNSNNDISASRRSAASERYPQFQRDLVHDNDSPTSPSSPTSPTPLPNSILSNLEHSFDLGVILDQGLIHVTSTTSSSTTSSNSVDVKNRLPLEEWMDYTTVGVYSDYADWSDLNQVDPCINDQCEQCEIPEDYKQTSINIDVLDYLGIQRVKPLQVNRNRNRHGRGHGRREDI